MTDQAVFFLEYSEQVHQPETNNLGEIQMNIDQIASEALRLDPKDRALLAEKIWASLEDPYILSPDMSDETAVKTAKRRDDEIENGKVTPVSHKDLMDRLRKDED